MRNMIIKTCSTVKLRSLGMNIHIKGRLVGNSSLWIFTRVDGATGDIPPLRPICMIRKMVDTQRVFCVFGHAHNSVMVFAEMLRLNFVADVYPKNSQGLEFRVPSRFDSGRPEFPNEAGELQYVFEPR